MNDLLEMLGGLLKPEQVGPALRAGVIILIGVVLIAVLRWRLKTSKRLGAHQLMLLRRLLVLIVLALTTMGVLHELGFELTTLLGAAGIFTVAFGFAAQTSMSNVISGVFLIGERPFVIGDVIKVGTTTGEVLSVDMMSIRLRTFDNLMVRIPNETILKADITNLTFFPIRRLDLIIPVNRSEQVSVVRQALEKVAEDNPLCLQEPTPAVMFTGLSEASLELQFSVWTPRQRFVEFRNEMIGAIVDEFAARDIEMPKPQRVLTGDGDSPVVVRLLAEREPDLAEARRED